MSDEKSTEDEVAEVAEKVEEALEGAAGELDDHEDVQHGVEAAADTAEAVAEAAHAVEDGREMVDAIQRGDAPDAVGGAVGMLGGAAGATGAVAEGVGRFFDKSGEVGHALERVASVSRTVAKVAEALREPLEDLTELIAGDPTKAVRFRFETARLASHEWGVKHFELEEALDEPYLLRIRVATEERDTDPVALLGTDIVLEIERRPAPPRRLCGVVRRIEEASAREDEEELVLTLEVVPALALLGLRRDSRIFQDRSVPEILEEVLGAALGEYGREVEVEVDESAYKKREYCVQLDETDLAFVSRLMEEEGLAYAFEHDGEVERMVVRDDNDAFERAPTLDGSSIPYIPRADVVRAKEPIYAFQTLHRAVTTRVALRDHDWTQQDLSVRIEANHESEDALGRVRESYVHTARVISLGGYDAGVRKYGEHDATRQARIRDELEQRDLRRATGIGRVTGFAPGLVFELSGHPALGADGEYVLTRVVHCSEKLPDADDGEVERYHNRFECVPLSVPWRPTRDTPRPRAHSLQSAVVRGPAGEEIHTDEHGRIKVEFHWDRRGRQDERSTCWIRVQQPWAGSGWGFVFLPRVGMEVLISFLDGDPDRPVAIGSLYNGSNLPPYALPDHKTRSTIKSNSSPGGNGYNELRFEDKAGSEEIFVHAQKDYNEVVEHDHTTTVHHDQTNSVDANQTESVGGHQTMTVNHNRTVHIKGSQSVTIDGGEANGGHSGSKLAITGDYKVDASDWIEVQAPTRIKLTCGGSSLLIEPGKITMTAGGQATVVLDANALMQSAAGSKVLLDANALAQSSGGSKVLLDANALAQSSGGSKVLLDSNALTQSSGGSKVLLDANALVAGATNATVQSTATTTVTAPTTNVAGSGTVNVNGGTTNVAGGTTNVAGGTLNASGGMVNISGGLVKIN
jgi:type VI secretion system secreted protein VgrG